MFVGNLVWQDILPRMVIQAVEFIINFVVFNNIPTGNRYFNCIAIVRLLFVVTMIEKYVELVVRSSELGFWLTGVSPFKFWLLN